MPYARLATSSSHSARTAHAPKVAPTGAKRTRVGVGPPLGRPAARGPASPKAAGAPRLPEPAMAQRPILAALGGSKLAAFISQACLVGVDSRAVALDRPPVG